MGDMRVGKAGIDAYPETAIDDPVGVGQRATDAIITPFHIGLPREIGAEEQTRADLARIEMHDEFVAREGRVVAQRQRESEPGGLRPRRHLRQDENILQILQPVLQRREIAVPRGDEVTEMIHLRETHRRLHVGDLQIEAEMRIDIFVVEALRQITEAPAETLVAAIVFAGLAITVAAPIAKRLHRLREMIVVGEDRAALAHSNVMRRIKRERADVAEGSDMLAVDSGAQRVAAVFDKPQIVTRAERLDRAHVEGIAERMGDHDRLRSRRDRRFHRRDVDIVSGNIDVDEDGNHAEQQDRIDRRRKAGGAGDDLVARLQRPVAQHRRGQRRKGDEICRGAGIDGERLARPDKGREPRLEGGVEAGGRQPEIQCGIDKRLHVARVIDAARNGCRRLARDKTACRMREAMIFTDEIENLRAQRLGPRRCVLSHDITLYAQLWAAQVTPVE